MSDSDTSIRHSQAIASPVAEFVFSADYYSQTVRRIRRQSLEHYAKIVLWLVMGGLLLGTIFVSRRMMDYLIPFIVIWPMFLLFRKYEDWSALRRFRKSPYYDQQTRIEFRDDGVYTKSELSESRVDWAAFTRVSHFRDGFLLIEDSQVAQWIAVKSLVDPDSIEQLQELLRQKIADHRVFAPAIAARQI